MKSIIGPLSLFILLSGCKQAGTSPVSASPQIQPGSCAIGKWNNLTGPLNLKISSDFDGDFVPADMVGGLNPIEQMAKAWNDAVSPNMALFTVPFNNTVTTGYNSLNSFRSADTDLGIYKSQTWFSNVSSNALAITQFYGVVKTDSTLGTYIDLTHADIILNYRDFASQFTMDGTALLKYDVPTIILHELGHFLGLCHESYSSSVMAPYYYTTQRSLKTFDVNKIRALYLNNQNYSAFSAKTFSKSNAIANPVGTEVRGIVELNANGKCRHFVNDKLVYEHTQGH